MKYLTKVSPSGLERRIDGGTITQGLNLAPGTGQVGITSFDLRLWPYVYTAIILRITGSVTGGAGGGTLVAKDLQYNFFRTIQLTINGSDTFQTWSGQALHFNNLREGGYRGTEVTGVDVPLAAAPAAGVAGSFDISLIIPFYQKTVYPRRFGLLNAYQNHNTTAFRLDLNMGGVTNFVTGDATATLTINPMQISYDIMDWTVMSNYGEQYVRETTFPRLEVRELTSNPVIALGTNQRIRLDRGAFYLRGLMIHAFLANGLPAPGNVTKISVVRNNTDPYYNNVLEPHNQRWNADNLQCNALQASGRSHVNWVDLAPMGEVGQMIPTLGLSDLDLFVDTTAAGNILVSEEYYNIPSDAIEPKNPGEIRSKAGTSY